VAFRRVPRRRFSLPRVMRRLDVGRLMAWPPKPTRVEGRLMALAHVYG